MEIERLGNLYGENRGTGFAGNVWNKNKLSPTITTMQGGMREPMIIDNVIIGGMQEHQSIKSDGVCTCLTSSMGMGGGYVPMIPETVKIKQATKDGYIECEVGGVADFSFPDSKTRRGRVQENGQVSPTLMAGEQDICRIEPQYRIRKLTPIECWRLMDFSDEDFCKAEQVNSNTQLYKQAGNSIVKNVLVAILGQMISGKEDFYKEVQE